MTRSLYQLILRMHPPAFRRRFGDEMMSIFDEAVGCYSSALILDGLLSFTRQWLLRTNSWKLLIALFGGFIQVFGFGMPIKGHQYWTDSPQALTPLMQQVLLFALSLICTLFVLITSMTLWNTRFQRQRSANRRSYLGRLSTSRHFGALQARK